MIVTIIIPIEETTHSIYERKGTYDYDHEDQGLVLSYIDVVIYEWCS